MAAQDRLVRPRHRNLTGLSDGFAFETAVYREAENEGVAVSQTSLYLVNIPHQSLVLRHFVMLRLLITGAGRLLGKLTYVIRPQGFGTDTQPGYGFDAVPDIGALSVSTFPSNARSL